MTALRKRMLEDIASATTGMSGAEQDTYRTGALMRRASFSPEEVTRAAGETCRFDSPGVHALHVAQVSLEDGATAAQARETNSVGSSIVPLRCISANSRNSGGESAGRPYVSRSSSR